VQYAKRVVGRKMYGGAQSYLPLKVDQSGVIAVIFAVSLLSVPMTIMAFSPEAVWAQKLGDFFNSGNWIYQTLYAALIIFFCYFYNSVSINPQDLAENMKKSGGFIPGIRPGEPTAKYIEWVVSPWAGLCSSRRSRCCRTGCAATSTFPFSSAARRF
jgi:preprotein translocase subunit SecY